MKKVITNLTLVLAFFLVTNADAQIVNIPDANFKALLVADLSINTNADGEIQVSEAIAFTGTIYAAHSGISDLTGIEAFTALTGLECNLNSLTSLNVTQNTALISLDCSDNQITSLDISHNPALTDFACFNNFLSGFNLSNNTALTNLSFSHNSLHSIDLSPCTALTSLYCSNNLLGSLSLTNNTALTYIRCDTNNITTLDVSHATSLATLLCNNNTLSTLDVSQNHSLHVLHSDNNFLQSLNVANGNNTGLSLYAINNPFLTCIQVDTVAWATTHWTVGGGNIDAIANFSLSCVSVQISTQPVNHLLACAGSSVNFSVIASGIGLTYHWRNGTTDIIDTGSFSGSTTATFTISPVNTSYSSLYYNVVVSGTNLLNDTSVNVSLTIDPLITVNLTSTPTSTCYVHDGTITSVVSGGSGIYSYAWNNGSTLANPVNLNAGNYDVIVTDGATCTQTAIDSVALPSTIVNIPDANFKALLLAANTINTNGDGEIQVCEAEAYTGLIDANVQNISDLTGIEAFTNLTRLICTGNNLTSLNVSQNTALTQLMCYNNSLSTIDISHNTNLTEFDCDWNFISSLDVSHNTTLQLLSCYYNFISSLDISHNTALIQLSCANNTMSSLDVHLNTALTSLDASHNYLTNLDISQNHLLNDLVCQNNPQLSNLDVANGNNINFIRFIVTANPNLPCIQVDNVAWSAANWTVASLSINSNESFSLSCPVITVSCSASFTLFPDTALLHHYFIINNATGIAPISYLWSWGDGNTDATPYPTHTYADTGLYTICLSVTDFSGCQSTICDSSYRIMRTANTMSVINVIAPLTGIKNITSQPLSVKVFPNPVNTTLNIHLSSYANSEELKITDVFGREVYKAALTGIDTLINVSQWSTGIYFYEIIGSGLQIPTSLRGKFVVQK